jgi:nucleotide-binding universal stress UspA family protein
MEEDPEKTEKEFTAQLDERLKAIPHEVVIARGETWNALLSFVEKKNIDLLVMGTHGRTGLGRAMLGSVAEAVFRQCQCPVLTIGPNVRRHPDQLIESKKILHPTDFTPASRAAIPYAISLAQEHQAHLVLLHVIQRPHAAELRHGGEFVSITMQLLRDLVTPEANFWVDSEQLVEYGSPAETILNVARQRAADLIVLGVRKARGRVGLATHFGRATACQVVSEAICPVLTVCG